MVGLWGACSLDIDLCTQCKTAKVNFPFETMTLRRVRLTAETVVVTGGVHGAVARDGAYKRSCFISSFPSRSWGCAPLHPSGFDWKDVGATATVRHRVAADI